MTQRISLSRPFFDEREAEAVRRVLATGWVVQGPEVEAFESEIAKLHLADHCIAVSSGTAALHICYLAMGIGAGDAVFIPSFAWPSAANMAKLVGARPVFVDVRPDSCNLDSADLKRAIDECRNRHWGLPRAVVAVHEFGLAADLDSIMEIVQESKLRLIEDAACALGAAWKGRPVGTFGELGIFSFHPRKSITTGEGGAIVTNNESLAALCRTWRNHGQRLADGRREFVLPGLNYRMTEFQAAIGRVQLEKFGAISESRQRLARAYRSALGNCPRIKLPPMNAAHTWQTFMLTTESGEDRNEIIASLANVGIESGPGSVAGHLAAPFENQRVLPVSEMLHHCGLALPLHPGLDPTAIPAIAAQIKNSFEQGALLPSARL